MSSALRVRFTIFRALALTALLCACTVSDPSAETSDAGHALTDAGHTQGDAGEKAQPMPSLLPTASASCPEITEGDVMFGRSKVRVWVGDDGMSALGPLVIYWHGTSSDPREVPFAGLVSGLLQAAVSSRAAVSSSHR